MITYDYAMLCSGENWRFNKPYSELARQFTLDKNKHNDSKVHVTTNDALAQTENMIVYPIESKYSPYYTQPQKQYTHDFAYNIKFLGIKNAYENADSEYIIWMDSDMQFGERYLEDNMQSFLSNCKTQDYDIIAPVICYEYRDDYAYKYPILGIEKATPQHCFEESFMVIKRSRKVEAFLKHWEQSYWKMLEAAVPQYGEGFEIGLAVTHAEMKMPDLYSKEFSIYRQFEPLRGVFWTYGDPGHVSMRFQ